MGDIPNVGQPHALHPPLAPGARGMASHSAPGRYLFAVAQIFNLLYRRFAIGRRRWAGIRTGSLTSAAYPTRLPGEVPSPNSSGAVTRFVAVALLAALWSGCALNKAAGPDARPGGGKPGTGTATAASPSTGKDRSNPAVTPDEGVSGKVVLVNPLLRFVIMDFPLRRLPSVEQRMNVYHQGQKIGEVKVTGPMRDTTIAGDIMFGQAQVGDEVRDD